MSNGSQKKPALLPLNAEELPPARRVFDAGYKAVERSLHPDAGGDAEAIKSLNLFADSVRGQFDLLEARP
jgi:hypothetical protein